LNNTTVIGFSPLNGQTDSFGRLRTSQLTSLIDIKQTYGQMPLIVDQVQNGNGSSTYNTNEASTTLGVLDSGDYAISQTKQIMRINIQCIL